MTSRPLLPVLLILALAAVLRLNDLSRWSLDGDELYSYYAVLELQQGESTEGVRGYPLGYLLMGASAALLGPTELGLRAAPALCGLLAVAALLLLRRDVVSLPVALVAGLLAALSPWLVYHAQEARFYAPLLLFAALATLWSLPGARQRPWRGLVCGVLAAACHPSALLLLPCLVAPLLGRWLPARAVVLLCGVAAVLGATWLLFGRSALPDLVQAALERRQLARYDLVHFAAGLGYALGPGLLLLVLAGAVVAWRQPVPGDRLLLACSALPPLVLLVLALVSVSVQQRYAMAAVPALLLLAGRGVEGLGGRRVLRGALLALALLLPLPQLWAHAQDGDRSDMRGAAAWLAEHATPDDVIVADEHALLALYLRRHEGFAQATVREETLSDKQLAGLPHTRNEVWVVLKRNRTPQAYAPEFTAWLEKYFGVQTELGLDPPSLVRHDNRLLILRRRERVPEGR